MADSPIPEREDLLGLSSRQKTTQLQRFPYRFIRFVSASGETKWGFPWPQLVAGFLSDATTEPGAKGKPDKVITFHFSIETVQVTGPSLDELWARLVRGETNRIDPNYSTIKERAAGTDDKVGYVRIRIVPPAEVLDGLTGQKHASGPDGK